MNHIQGTKTCSGCNAQLEYEIDIERQGRAAVTQYCPRCSAPIFDLPFCKNLRSVNE